MGNLGGIGPARCGADYSRADPALQPTTAAHGLRRASAALLASAPRTHGASGWTTAEQPSMLRRIAEALERAFPPTAVDTSISRRRRLRLGGPRRAPAAGAAAWRVPFDLLCGIERVADTLYDNTRRFARGLPANNALLWGARGMGKSSLVKAIHARSTRTEPQAPGADRDPSRGHREPAAACCICWPRAAGAVCCSATTCRSMPARPATNRSRPCSRAASRAGPAMSCSTRPRTAAT